MTSKYSYPQRQLDCTQQSALLLIKIVFYDTKYHRQTLKYFLGDLGPFRSEFTECPTFDHWSRLATCLHTCPERLTKKMTSQAISDIQRHNNCHFGQLVVSSWAIETCVVMVIVTNRDQRSGDITYLQTIITMHYRHNGPGINSNLNTLNNS